MRLIQIMVPDDQRDIILDELRERDLGYVVTDGAADQSDSTHISFVVPADAVEHVLQDLQENGFERNRFTVSLSTEFANFQNVDEVQDKWAKSPNKVAPTTLRSKAKDMRRNTRSYVWMMALSAVVATAGLVLASPAVVVGSMVIAPIVGPMITASVGAVRNDRDMFLDSIHMQAIGLGVGFVCALLFSLLVKYFFAVPTTLNVPAMELVSIRMSPGMLSVVVGLTAGAAGAYGLATTGRVTIVGVMIAAALIPTAAAAGIGLAWGNVVVGTGSLMLLTITIIAVNVGSYLMFRYLGYRPDNVDEGILTTNSTKQTAVLVGTVLLVVAVVLAAGIGTYQQIDFERTVNTATTEVLNQDRYQLLGVTDIGSTYTGIGPTARPTNVTVTVTKPANQTYPGLPNALDRRITELTGKSVTVDVRYVDRHQSNVSGA